MKPAKLKFEIMNDYHKNSDDNSILTPVRVTVGNSGDLLIRFLIGDENKTITINYRTGEIWLRNGNLGSEKDLGNILEE